MSEYCSDNNKCIKVLQFPVAASKGGRTRYVLDLWEHIDKNRFQFDFVTFSSELDFETKLINEGCKVFHIHNYPEKNRAGFIREFREILKNGYDVIEIHTSFWKDTIVECLSKEAGIGKIIIHAHSTGITQITADNKEQEEQAKEKHNDVKEQINEKIATDFWACSVNASKWLFEPQIPAAKIAIINNTINTKKFRFNADVRQKIRRELKIEERDVIGFVGRLEPVKNLYYLLDIFSISLRSNNNLTLLLVGDGSEKAGLEEYAKTKNIRDHIIFTGKLDNPADCYMAMDCFALPSLFEGFSLVFLEAQCSGLKCVCSEGIPDEAVVLDNACKLSLQEKDRWVNFLNHINHNYERFDRSDDLIRLGYDTSNKIKEIERLYLKKS